MPFVIGMLKTAILKKIAMSILEVLVERSDTKIDDEILVKFKSYSD